MEILTVRELARMLKLDPQTIYRKTKEGKIPATFIDGSVRFDKAVIEKWLTSQTQVVIPEVNTSQNLENAENPSINPINNPSS